MYPFSRAKLVFYCVASIVCTLQFSYTWAHNHWWGQNKLDLTFGMEKADSQMYDPTRVFKSEDLPAAKLFA